MEDKREIPVFNASSYCATCGGICCKRLGCHFAPSDFKEITFESLKAEIEKGFISIDWWDGEYEPEYFLRMRHKGEPIVDPSWGGECILLTDTGCPLSFEERPLGARSLEPVDGGGCVVHYSKRECKNDWLVYKDILMELKMYFEE